MIIIVKLLTFESSKFLKITSSKANHIGWLKEMWTHARLLCPTLAHEICENESDDYCAEKAKKQEIVKMEISKFITK